MERRLLKLILVTFHLDIVWKVGIVTIVTPQYIRMQTAIGTMHFDEDCDHIVQPMLKTSQSNWGVSEQRTLFVVLSRERYSTNIDFQTEHTSP